MHPNHYRPFALWIGGILFFSLVSFSYIQTELTTKFYLKDIGDWAKYCQIDSNADFRSVKILSYEKYKGQAQIYCLYTDNSKNSRLLLNYLNGKWEVAFTKKLNADSEFYWPVYF